MNNNQFRSHFKKIFFDSTVQNLFELGGRPFITVCIVEHKKQTARFERTMKTNESFQKRSTKHSSKNKKSVYALMVDTHTVV